MPKTPEKFSVFYDTMTIKNEDGKTAIVFSVGGIEATHTIYAPHCVDLMKGETLTLSGIRGSMEIDLEVDAPPKETPPQI